LRADPVAALELMVDLYLDPEIASPRKVSVWYAFWGEASSRQEYYDICGQKDEGFAVLVRELIGRLIEDTAQSQLDPDGIALGLIGVLEMLWQDFAFRSEKDIDRPAAKARCMAYLKSIFPGQFPGARGLLSPVQSTPRSDRLAAWVYATEFACSLERDSLFRNSWQIVAHESQLSRAGEFLTADLGIERVLLVRDGFGAVHALRNSCPQLPHALTSAPRGRFPDGIECAAHGLRFGTDGRREAGAGGDLAGLDMTAADGFFWVRAMAPSRSADPEGQQPRGDSAPVPLVAEQWLEMLNMGSDVNPSAFEATVAPPGALPGWSATRYRRLAGTPDEQPWSVRFIAPNQLLERRPDGLSVLQIIPAGPARCRVRRLHVASAIASGEERCASALQYLAERRLPRLRGGSVAIAESAQRGLSEFGYRASGSAPSPAVAWLRRYLAARLPALASERPPSESRQMHYNRPPA
jgi:phenylpropionate dioxygenase-like ring-hydroxylating dioxygenase large terminal subunit